MVEHFTTALSNLLNTPGCCVVIACDFPQDDIRAFHRFTAGYEHYNIEFTFGACMVSYESQRIYFRQIADIREAYRFAGVNINVLIVDMLMPAYVLDYMRSRVRPILNDDGTTHVSGSLVLTNKAR